MIDLNAVGAALLSQGLSGIVIIGLCWFILEQRKEIKELRTETKEVQEKRISEGREGFTALAANTNILDDLVKAYQQGASK